MLPGVPWSFGASWHGQTDAEKALLVRDYLRSVNRPVPFKFELPDVISSTAQAAYVAFGKLPNDSVRDAVVRVFEEDLRAKGLWTPNVGERGAFSWLRNPALPTQKAVLCASWMLEKEGKGPLRVSALREFLAERVGRPVSNLAGEIKDLSSQHPPLLEYVSRSKGRAGITYKVTLAGGLVAKELQDEFIPEDEEEAGSDT